MMSFGEKIRKLREIKGLSVRELGRRCKPPIDPGYLSRLENGKIGIGTNIIQRLSEALEIPIEKLLELAKPSEKEKVDEQYIHLINALPDENQWNNYINFFNAAGHGIDPNSFLLPKFRDNENVPDKMRRDLIRNILKLDLDEVEYFYEMIRLYIDLQANKNIEVTFKGAE